MERSKIYEGQEAEAICSAIVAQEDYSTPIPGVDVLSTEYYEENGKYVAYDNRLSLALR
jgi:hypothetical protein